MAVTEKLPTLGIVVIGRNEGQRLICCLKSVTAQAQHVVYVDSGSADDSVSAALELGVDVVELDLSVPFTAARARNMGWRHLVDKHAEIRRIQFLDGDCELMDGWLEAAFSALSAQADLAVVCGRRRERYPEASVFNRLCDVEWDTAPGITKACGGDSLMRVAALQAVDGFNDSVIAGEEPELCFRMREIGWKVLRVQVEMTLHDAAITHVRQWWQRTKRAGFAYAANYRRHNSAKFKLLELRSAWFWGAALPVSIFALGLLLHPLFFFGFMLFPLQVLRIAWLLHRGHRNLPFGMRLTYGVSCLLSKIPQMAGILSEIRSHRRGQAHIIEYK